MCVFLRRFSFLSETVAVLCDLSFSLIPCVLLVLYFIGIDCVSHAPIHFNRNTNGEKSEFSFLFTQILFTRNFIIIIIICVWRRYLCDNRLSTHHTLHTVVPVQLAACLLGYLSHKFILNKSQCLTRRAHIEHRYR